MKIEPPRIPRWTPGHLAYLLNTKGTEPRHEAWLDNPGIAEEYGVIGRQVADSAFVWYLRTFVQSWLDSGKDATGKDQPLKRNLRTQLPGSDQTLHEVLEIWLTKNVPEHKLLETGEITIRAHAPPKLQGLEPWAFGLNLAFYWLMELLNRPGAHRLARCHNPACRRPYYVRRRMPRKLMERATYCPLCKGVASMVRMHASRARRKQDLVERAAEHWNKWPRTPRYPKQSAWVAEQMNKKLSKPITQKWVAQNQKEIEAEATRRAHAKS